MGEHCISNPRHQIMWNTSPVILRFMHRTGAKSSLDGTETKWMQNSVKWSEVCESTD